MSTQSNKDSARSYFENFLNAGDLDVAAKLFAANCRFHYPLGELQGVEAITQYIVAVRSAFPDLHFKIQDLFGEDALVACRWTLTATQTGEFRDQEPTGKRVEVPGTTVFRMSKGLIEEMWVAFNPALLT